MTIRCLSCGSQPVTYALQTCCAACYMVILRSLTPRPCLQCKEMYKPVAYGARYCSRDCATAAALALRGVRECKACARKFSPEFSGSLYCSVACKPKRGRGLTKAADNDRCPTCDSPVVRSGRGQAHKRFCSFACTPGGQQRIKVEAPSKVPAPCQDCDHARVNANAELGFVCAIDRYMTAKPWRGSCSFQKA